ncbi:MAG: YkvA family protein [Caulobacteraceae bacterium]
MNDSSKASPSVKREVADDVLDPSKALVPVTIKVNEQRVARGFWPKFRKVAAKIPFAQDLLAVWYCARDPKTPATAKGLMLAGLAYFVLPTDAVPDFLVGFGFTDDAAVIAALLALVGKNLKDSHRLAAQGLLEKLSKDD